MGRGYTAPYRTNLRHTNPPLPTRVVDVAASISIDRIIPQGGFHTAFVDVYSVKFIVGALIAFDLTLHTAKKGNSTHLIPLTSVVAGNKAGLVFSQNPARAVVATGIALHLALRTAQKRNPDALVPLTSVVAGDKAGLIVRSNPVIAVVATGIALHLALRTTEKRNPTACIPLTSVVAGDEVTFSISINTMLQVPQKLAVSDFTSASHD